MEGTSDPVQVYTNYKNLEYFITNKLLNRRQARWAKLLSRFNFKIIYRPGPQNIRADTLTRYFGDRPEEEDSRRQQQWQIVLKERDLEIQTLRLAPVDVGLEDSNSDINSETSDTSIETDASEARNGRVYYRDRLFVPDDADLRLRLVREAYDGLAAGYSGRTKTYEILCRYY